MKIALVCIGVILAIVIGIAVYACCKVASDADDVSGYD